MQQLAHYLLILGLDSCVSLAVLKSACRREMFWWHPDLHEQRSCDVYGDVPEPAFMSFMRAESHGSFPHRHIYNGYRSQLKNLNFRRARLIAFDPVNRGLQGFVPPCANRLNGAQLATRAIRSAATLQRADIGHAGDERNRGTCSSLQP